MRVLITGATGFLGYHLCHRLVMQDHEVTAFHRQSSHTARIQALGVRRIQGDLGDLDGLRHALRGQDAVIHAAGADLKYWSKHENLQEQVNVLGTRNVARASRLEGIPRFLHVSSVCAIGIPQDRSHPADEGFQFNLQNEPLVYHISKKRGEEAVLEEVEKGLDAVIVNPATIFGPHGPDYRGGEMIRKVARGKIVPHFTGGFCAVHVADVVNGTLAALQRGIAGRRYILGGENLTYREIALRSLAALELHRPLVPIPPLVTAALAALLAPVGKIRNRRPRFNPAIHYCCSRFQYYLSNRARLDLGYTFRNFDSIIRECLSVWDGASRLRLA